MILKSYWKNFSTKELSCTCCGCFNPNSEFTDLMDMVQVLRTRLGFPIGVSSGYRCTEHPIEARKIAKGGKAGHHTHAAIDLAVDRAQAYALLREAFKLGFTGIGVQQKGEGRFIHLDIRENPTIWSY